MHGVCVCVGGWPEEQRFISQGRGEAASLTVPDQVLDAVDEAAEEQNSAPCEDSCHACNEKNCLLIVVELELVKLSGGICLARDSQNE